MGYFDEIVRWLDVLLAQADYLDYIRVIGGFVIFMAIAGYLKAASYKR